jgi:hypothetical protein
VIPNGCALLRRGTIALPDGERRDAATPAMRGSSSGSSRHSRLMQTEAPALLATWTAHRDDLTSFEGSSQCPPPPGRPPERYRSVPTYSHPTTVGGYSVLAEASLLALPELVHRLTLPLRLSA